MFRVSIVGFQLIVESLFNLIFWICFRSVIESLIFFSSLLSYWWLHDFLWAQTSQVIQSYSSSLFAYDLHFLFEIEFVYCFNVLVIFISGALSFCINFLIPLVGLCDLTVDYEQTR